MQSVFEFFCPVRPEIHCTFEIMDRCTAHYHDGELDACRAGARDAHLLSDQSVSYSATTQSAYDAGRNTTLLDCTGL